jgi:hypothetical protein
MLTLSQYLSDPTTATLTDAEVVVAFNADKRRIKRDTPMSLAEIGEALTQIVGADAAIAAADRLFTDATENVAAVSPSIMSMLRQFQDGGKINLGADSIRASILKIAESPGDFTAQDAAAFLSFATGPDVTEADVTEARAAIATTAARDAIQTRFDDAKSAADVAIEQGGTAAAVKAAFDAQWGSD